MFYSLSKKGGEYSGELEREGGGGRYLVEQVFRKRG